MQFRKPTMPSKMLILANIILLLASCYGFDYKSNILSRESIENNAPKLETYIEKEMNLYGVEEVSIAISIGQDLILAKVFGAPKEERFRAASITKALLAYAALLLVDEGKLMLDEPLYQYAKMEYFPNESKSKKVTLRMVLNHSSGMSNSNNVYDWHVYVEPGKEFHYSTSAFIYLLNIMQDVVAGGIDAYMQKNVLLPLGMNNSTFETLAYKGKIGLVNGGLVTTASDLAIFYSELANPNSMHASVNGKMLSDSIRINGNSYWGLGVGLQHGNGLDILWQTGNSKNIWHSFVYYSISDRTGIVVMTKGKNGNKIYQDIAHYGIGGSYYNILSALKTAINPK